MKPKARIGSMIRSGAACFAAAACCVIFACAAGKPGLIRDITVQNGTMAQFDRDEHSYSVEIDSGEAYADLVVTPANDRVMLEISGDERPLDPVLLPDII